jgi:5'-3' exonuclease
MTGIAWTFIYYKQGLANANPNFLYSNNYAPMMNDVAKYYMDRRGPVKRNEVDIDYSLPVLLQLLAVLPPQSEKQFPVGLRKFLESDSPIADMFPKKVFVDTDGKDLERLGIVNISVVQPIRLFSVSDDIEMTDEELEKYDKVENISYLINENEKIDGSLDVENIEIRSQVVKEKGIEQEVETYVKASVKAKIEKISKFDKDLIKEGKIKKNFRSK